jgi:hypothetical protein
MFPPRDRALARRTRTPPTPDNSIHQSPSSDFLSFPSRPTWLPVSESRSPCFALPVICSEQMMPKVRAPKSPPGVRAQWLPRLSQRARWLRGASAPSSGCALLLATCSPLPLRVVCLHASRQRGRWHAPAERQTDAHLSTVAPPPFFLFVSLWPGCRETQRKHVFLFTQLSPRAQAPRYTRPALPMTSALQPVRHPHRTP